jgi:hypothetical protein
MSCSYVRKYAIGIPGAVRELPVTPQRLKALLSRRR